jgi:hypothetical protein
MKSPFLELDSFIYWYGMYGGYLVENQCLLSFHIFNNILDILHEDLVYSLPRK